MVTDASGSWVAQYLDLSVARGAFAAGYCLHGNGLEEWAFPKVGETPINSHCKQDDQYAGFRPRNAILDVARNQAARYLWASLQGLGPALQAVESPYLPVKSAICI